MHPAPAAWVVRTAHARGERQELGEEFLLLCALLWI
jgi:hypothetical protein